MMVSLSELNLAGKAVSEKELILYRKGDSGTKDRQNDISSNFV